MVAITRAGAEPAAGGIDLLSALKDSVLAALVALVLAVPIIGLQTVDVGYGDLGINQRWGAVVAGVALVFFGRLYMALARQNRRIIGGIVGAAAALIIVRYGFGESWLEAGIVAAMVLAAVALRQFFVSGAGQAAAGSVARSLGGFKTNFAIAGVVFAFAVPVIWYDNRYIVDVATLTLIYVMLGWGLNIVVGLAGLLDLGYVAFYAVGAYSYALLALNFDLSFWICLPLAGALAAGFGVLLGFPVLRLRGDYLAIVTLGFGEMVRLILINWYNVTNGPNGLSGIPRPSFFGLKFDRRPDEGEVAFHQFLGIEYDSMHRLVFLYLLILVLALATNWFTLRIRRLPMGRAWEALREDEVACRTLGINPTNTKLTAFAMGAMFAGFAGSFFATRQGFISPESFVFIESAVILAIVVLGGMGSQIGVVIAACVLILAPEIFRELEEFRMLAFGAGMVLIMIWRPRGLIAGREPTIYLNGTKRERAKP